MSGTSKSTQKAAKAARGAARKRKPKAPPLPMLPASGTVGEKWMFGENPRAIEGCLNAYDPKRDALIEDKGEGIRVYRSSRPKGRNVIVDFVRNTCSHDLCITLDECRHRWEDRFRFGDLKGRDFVIPAPLVLITDKGARRNRKRPNPRTDGRSHRTVKRHANIVMPTRGFEILKQAIDLERERDGRRARGRGQPATDFYDIAMMGVLRFWEQLPLEHLNARTQQVYESRDGFGEGLIRATFDYARLNEAMTGTLGERRRPTKSGLSRRVIPEDFLARVLDRLKDRLLRPARNVARVFFVDGTVLSSAETDNARRRRFDADGAARLCLHAMYDVQFGMLTAWRLTWHERGRGSAETIQYPYLLGETMKTFDASWTLTDRGYGSDRNFAVAHKHGVRLVAKLRKNSFNPKTKRYLSEADADWVYREFGPQAGAVLRQLDDFRFKNECWHAGFKSKTGKNGISSRPDRSRTPDFIGAARQGAAEQDFKAHPNRAEVLLPEEQAERDHIIATEQFTGWATENEIRFRQICTILRALVLMEVWYNETVNLRADRAFQPRPEDDLVSPFRAFMPAA